MAWYLGRTKRGDYELGTKLESWDSKLGFSYRYSGGGLKERVVHRMFRRRTPKGPRAFNLQKGQVVELKNVTMNVLEDTDD